MFLLIAAAWGASSAATRLLAKAAVSMPEPEPSCLTILAPMEAADVVLAAVEDADVLVPGVVVDEDEVEDDVADVDVGVYVGVVAEVTEVTMGLP